MKMRTDLSYRLRLSDFDRYFHLMPSAILDLFTDIATINADEMGMGLDDIRPKGLMWAVVRTKYEIVKQPKVHSEVVVSTWPHSLSRVMFHRDTLIATPEGEPLVKATAEWVTMDFNERKFVDPHNAYQGPDNFCEERMFDGKLRKLHDFEPQGEGVVITPQWTDVDVNLHVNNAKYVNHAFDALKLQEGEEVKTLQVDFRKEVLPDVPFTMYTRRDESGLHAKGVDEEGTILFALFAELA